MSDKIIAYVTRDEYLAIHTYCKAHDVDNGGVDDIYDARSGGAINIWSREEWDKKPHGLSFGSLYPERGEAPDNEEAIEALMTDSEVASWFADREEGDALVFAKSLLSLRLTGWKWVAVLFSPGDLGTFADGQMHFRHLYRRALGADIPLQRLPRT